MNREQKKFIETLPALANNETLKAFALTNTMAFALCNIQRNADGTTEFDTITDFTFIEHYRLDKEDIALFDCFNHFSSPKNAMNVLLYALETGGKIGHHERDHESKLAPKDGLPENLKGKKSYLQFIQTIEPEQHEKLLAIGTEWLQKFHRGKSTFDFFFLNGITQLADETEPTTYQTGDYLIGYDSQYGQEFATRVLQASPGGLITCIDDRRFFTLATGSDPKKCNKEEISKEALEILDAQFKSFTTSSEDYKTERLAINMEAAEKLAKKKAERERIEANKADAKKKEDASLLKLKDLEAKPLTNEGEIKAAIEALNADAKNMTAKHITSMKELIKAAQTKAKEAAAKNAKPKDTAPTHDANTGEATPPPTKKATPKKAAPKKADKAAPEATTGEAPNAKDKAPKKAAKATTAPKFIFEAAPENETPAPAPEKTAGQKKRDAKKLAKKAEKETQPA